VSENRENGVKSFLLIEYTTKTEHISDAYLTRLRSKDLTRRKRLAQILQRVYSQ